MLRLARLSLVLALATVVAACSGVGPDSPLTEEPAYPAYETFDPAAYPAQAPAVAVPASHDVPARLMDGRVEVPTSTAPAPDPEPQPRQVDGYRVQVFSSEDRDRAERVRDEATAWLQQNPDAAGAMPYGRPLVAYLQPYYRVRLGSFAVEEDARRALELVRRQYPEAFLVSDLVTVLE